MSAVGKQEVAQLVREVSAGLCGLGKRFVLAMLGIVIGSSSVIALMNIGGNAAADAASVFKDLGADIMVVRLQQPAVSRSSPQTVLDVDQLREMVPSLLSIAPISQAGSEVSLRGGTVNAHLVGSVPDLAHAARITVRDGRFLSEFDRGETYAVVGRGLADELEGEGSPVRVGDRLQINGYLFLVIGILDSGADAMLLPFKASSSVFLPLSGMPRIGGTAHIDGVVIRVAPNQDMEAIASATRRALEKTYDAEDIEVTTPEQIIEGMAKQGQTFSYLLGALAGISLVVGGVGVMNVMFMNVSERRREIGVRMALGARRRDIRNLFLLEAMALTAVGAVLGAIIGVLCAFLYARLSGWDFSLVPSSILLGLGSTSLVGLVSGLCPAISASRLQPVEALREE